MRLQLSHASVVRLDKAWSSTPDLVQDIRLILVQEGYGLWSIDSRSHLFGPNDLIFLKPGQLRHARMVPEQPVRYLAVRFSICGLDGPLPQWLMLPSILRLTPGVRAEVEGLVEQMRRESVEKRDHYLEIVDSLARRLFITLVRHRRECEGRPPHALDPEISGRHPEIERVIHYIYDHLAEPIDTDRLARIAGMSPAKFRRVFRSLTGMSPHRYVIRTRMWRAQELLSGGNFYVYEVARAVGYEDNLYFSRLFRHVVGVSPTDYRAQHALP